MANGAQATCVMLGPCRPKNHSSWVRKITISSAGSVSMELMAGASRFMMSAGSAAPPRLVEASAMPEAAAQAKKMGMSALKLSDTMSGTESGSLMTTLYFTSTRAISTVRMAAIIEVKSPEEPKYVVAMPSFTSTPVRRNRTATDEMASMVLSMS